MTYLKKWLSDFRSIAQRELGQIFSDSGVLLIFFIAGLAYPLLYNFVYLNGTYDDMPIAVVDNADCYESREFIRECDATRELRVEYKCTDMNEARMLMEQRKVKGIMMFPRDFGEKMAYKETATLSVYCDMSSFFYYKCLLMGANHVMLQEMGDIQLMRYTDAGMTDQEAAQLVQAVPYEENNPYNPAFSYSIFLISVILLIIIQQTMFYGMSLLQGTMRERGSSFSLIPGMESRRGALRIVFGRGCAYWLIYMAVGLYIAVIVPALFGVPQRGEFWDVVLLILIFVTDCVFFSLTWSSFITRRESVFVLFLFMSPICVFLTGTSWPVSAMPEFWKLFSYIFPSTFGAQAFINISTAGGDLLNARGQLIHMVIQTDVYFVLAAVLIYLENLRATAKK